MGENTGIDRDWIRLGCLCLGDGCRDIGGDNAID